MSELLPCPFCGKPPVFLATSEDDNFIRCYEVRCDYCGIEVSEEYKDQTVELWNTRAPAQRMPIVTDEMVTRALEVQNLDLIQGFTYRTRHVIRDFRTDKGTELWSCPRGDDNHAEMMKRIEFIRMKASLEAVLSSTKGTGP